MKSANTNTVINENSEYLFLRLRKRSKIVFNFIIKFNRQKIRLVLRIRKVNHYLKIF